MRALSVLLMIALPVITAFAHEGDQVFFIPYVSPDDLAYIHIDGDVTEWRELLGEPVLTPFDFKMLNHKAVTSYSEYDPSNLDFRIWMAWSDGGKIYFAAQAADDVYRNPDKYREYIMCDHMVLSVDGDHSGGKYIYVNSSGEYKPPDPRNNAQAQYYEAKSYSAELPLVSMGFFHETSWMIEQPYAQGSGSVLGENPIFWTVEFYVTAFDDMNYLSPEDSVISSFEPGQVIGFDLAVIDWDHDDTRNGQFYLHDPSQESEAVGADGFVDAILLGPEGTAVEATTWARLKATSGVSEHEKRQDARR